MTNKERLEIVNAARSYERIIGERRGYFVKSLSLAREKRQTEAVEERKKYHDSKARANKSEKLLAERIYHEHDFVRVDDVVYMAYSTETLLRIPLDMAPDLAQEGAAQATE